METQQQQERMELVNRVFHLDSQSYLFGGVMANNHMAWESRERDYGRVDWMRWDVDLIHKDILRLINAGSLARNQSYIRVLQNVAEDPQFSQKFWIDANTSMILTDLVAQGIFPPTEAVVSQIVIDRWTDLVDNQQHTQDKAETEKRNAQISQMTQGGTTGFTVQIANRKVAYTKEGRLFDPLGGQAQGFSMALKGPWSRGAGSKPFSEMTNDEVQAFYDAWKVSSDLRNLPVEQLREIVKNKSNPYGTKPTLQLPHVAAPDTQDRLHHPQSGEAFTQKSLIHFINVAPYNGRDLITRNGRIVPRLRDLFERTVRGELG